MKKNLIVLLLSTALFAADNLLEITPQIGGSWHISNDRYDNNVDLSYGLKFAERVLPNVLLEVGFDYMKANYNLPNTSTHVNRYYINLVREFNTQNKVSPYILGGVGYEYMSNTLQSMDSDFFGQYGLGLRYALADFLHLKAELRHLVSMDGRSDILGMVGFTIPFGTYGMSERVIVEEVLEEVLETPVVKEGLEAPAPLPLRIHRFSVRFPFDSSVVAPTYKAEIKDFAESMKQNPSQIAVISGHTDSIGDDIYNEKLSKKRANAVKDAIVQEGIEANRLKAKGYGETKPIANNETREGRAQNRRVEAEIYIIDKGY